MPLLLKDRVLRQPADTSALFGNVIFCPDGKAYAVVDA
jgi:hypothetical protein